MLAVTIEKDAIRIGTGFAMTFQRTLRIPSDGRAYPLSPGLGRLPLLRVADYADRVPPHWREPGGAFIPLRQCEAVWLGFHAAASKPHAVKITVGGINALTGQRDEPTLHTDPRDYLVCPNQPWLDGTDTGDGSVRQFVATSLGVRGKAAAGIAGEIAVNCLEITLFAPKSAQIPGEPPRRRPELAVPSGLINPDPCKAALVAERTITQKIYPDAYGIDTWSQADPARIVVHLVNSEEFVAITGQDAPGTPIDASTYARYGVPWLDGYCEPVRGSPTRRASAAGIPTAFSAKLFAW